MACKMDQDFAAGNFKAIPTSTGSWLAQQESVLAIQCFLPEIWTGMSNESALITWEKNYHLSWKNTGIPFIHDLTPGYDAHIVFPSSPVYGNTQSWRDLQTQAVGDFSSQSLTFNAWYGYTEGMVGVPTVQHGDANFIWMCSHFAGNCSYYSERANLEFSQDNLEVLPNPVISFAEIRLRDQRDHIISYKIADSNGIILKARKVSYNKAPVSSINIQLEDIIPGLYFLIVETSKSSYTKKVLKLDVNVK
jgi:hypothetical protein